MVFLLPSPSDYESYAGAFTTKDLEVIAVCQYILLAFCLTTLGWLVFNVWTILYK